MTIAEQKLKLIERISSVDNPLVIEELMKLMDINEDERVYTFSEAQQSAIQEAREQYKAREYLSHEEANQESEKWLKD